MTAAIEPVQAPVIGNGIATNRISPIRLYFWTILPRRIVLSNNQLKKRLKTASLLNNLVMASRNNRIKGTGSIFPMTAKKKA